jgi:hypothetical protein
MTPGDIVKLVHPVDRAEASARFVLIEDNGDRCLIRLICDLPIAPVECVLRGEIEKAE